MGILLLPSAVRLHGQQPDGWGGARSLLLPGWEQYRQEQGRWKAYALVEAVGLAGTIHQRGEASTFRNRYRNLAWEVARGGSGPRERDGTFEYYEAMANFRASGAFDRRPDLPQLVPEDDPTTYNGSIWRLSRQLFALPDDVAVDDPAARGALDHYRSRAIQPGFLWDWGNEGAARDRFSRWIGASDDARARATLLTGMVVANHLISAVDAWLPGPPLDARLQLHSRGTGGSVLMLQVRRMQ